MDAQMKRTWAEVDFDKLAHNYHALRGLAPAGTKYFGLVKADAYGHGAVPVAKKLEELGADYLGVACLDEAIEVREAGVKTPILILGCTSSIYAAELVKYNITQACYDLEYAKELSAGAQKAGGTITVHIQCDTGMTRLGFMCHEDTMEKSASEIIEAVMVARSTLCSSLVVSRISSREFVTWAMSSRFVTVPTALPLCSIPLPTWI